MPNALDVPALAGSMSEAFLASLGRSYPGVRAYARAEFQHLATWFDTLASELRAKRVTREQARLLLQMQIVAARNVFLTVKGLGLLAVEAAINAALDVVRGAVNQALRFALL